MQTRSLRVISPFKISSKNSGVSLAMMGTSLANIASNFRMKLTKTHKRRVLDGESLASCLRCVRITQMSDSRALFAKDINHTITIEWVKVPSQKFLVLDKCCSSVAAKARTIQFCLSHVQLRQH